MQAAFGKKVIFQVGIERYGRIEGGASQYRRIELFKTMLTDPGGYFTTNSTGHGILVQYQHPAGSAYSQSDGIIIQR